ncbi:hypothetical protein UH38_09885 [Aliterella atlantica CENA595]|uniref:Uncharacterized protein n=1 Tax=Aliterella atlantica CENA595 TaxID=1618023 RepID=A0A0D8ZXQ6_9CYAN|nr:hypothetical protein UH38_09885 [Aliterella atlantica CENA595]
MSIAVAIFKTLISSRSLTACLLTQEFTRFIIGKLLCLLLKPAIAKQELVATILNTSDTPDPACRVALKTKLYGI